jgi:hypothetical protein
MQALLLQHSFEEAASPIANDFNPDGDMPATADPMTK